MRQILKIASGLILAVLACCLWYGLRHGYSLFECGSLMLPALEMLLFVTLCCLLFCLLFLVAVWILYVPTYAVVYGVQQVTTSRKLRAAAKALRREMGTELLPASMERGRGDEASAGVGVNGQGNGESR
jgi:hypothetical protein